jgi:hypothetical protein
MGVVMLLWDVVALGHVIINQMLLFMLCAIALGGQLMPQPISSHPPSTNLNATPLAYRITLKFFSAVPTSPLPWRSRSVILWYRLYKPFFPLFLSSSLF